MILWTRVSLVSFFAAAAVAATGLAWRASSRTCPVPRHAEPQALPAPAVADEPAEPTPEAIAAGDDGAANVPVTAEPTDDSDAVDSPAASIAVRGELYLDWFPRSYVHDVTDDQATDLLDVVNSWVSGGIPPHVQYRRGVVRVHSDEDRGDDPPYPRSAAAFGERICGEPATWMSDAIRQRLHWMGPGDITCSHNICSYGGSEYAPTGYLIFRPVTYMDEQTWVLDAWVEVYTAALSSDVVEKNDADVVRLMKRVASTSCPGEPAGMY